ncbi:argininosuccinate synthase [Halobacterium jilantaiense]|uniref:Argininosuccinate synthase n=1 Tax=Halobacterium jilantaiense TaxID=355548 RepID=A0A1I0PLJ7_9EURY|nr:argininosuccinate synthase [Halobacterium jilantaiense]SEW15287.1 argininosuccinate synthase [Halobacterium jilantaiense]
MPSGTVALAFSGGLDTTVCVPLLKEEYGYDDVIGVTVDVGQPDAEFAEAHETADALGVEHHVVDAKAEFADLCFDAVQAGATYQGYPLGTALARPVIAEAILDVAEDEGCTALAHGCTGKGNDQLRFEAVWRASDLDVLAPVRELGLTREWEIDYADEKGLPVEAGNEGEWSIDTNLWSRSVEGGHLEDPGYQPPEDIYDWTDEPTGDTETVDITFEAGEPVAVDGKAMEPVPLIEYLNDLAGSYGVGRTDMMEDRMLGLKVRENYEHPAATTLLAAHDALEGLVLTKDERDFTEDVSQQWAQKAYEGLVDHPLMDALNGYFAETQSKVTGTVTVKFEGGQARPVARESEHAVYSADAASFDTETVNGIEQADATGVAKYHGFQSRLANASKPELKTDGGPGEEGAGATEEGASDE